MISTQPERCQLAPSWSVRWLAPLPIQDIVREANATGRVLVDETRSSAGVAEGVVTALIDEGFTGPLAHVAS